MAKPPLRANYRRKLTRPLTLHDGRKLTTLRDGANVLLDVFGAVNARSCVLDLSVRRLLKAAQQRQLRRHPGGDQRAQTSAGGAADARRPVIVGACLARRAGSSGGVCCASFSYRKNGEHAVLGGNGRPTNGTAGKLETPRDAPQHGEVVEARRHALRTARHDRYCLSVCGAHGGYAAAARMGLRRASRKYLLYKLRRAVRRVSSLTR